MPAAYYDKRSKPCNSGPIADVATAGAAPTQAQYNGLVAAFNLLLAACRDAGIVGID